MKMKQDHDSISLTGLGHGPRFPCRSRRDKLIILGFTTIIFFSLGILYAAWYMTCKIDVPHGTGHNKVYRVEIHYETLCPDSKYFIVKQFLPFFTKFSEKPVYTMPLFGTEPKEQHRIFINPVFVPYGKASTRKDSHGFYNIDCQHGELECRGNTVHACAIKYIQKQGPGVNQPVNSSELVDTRNKNIVSFIACMIKDNRRPIKIAERCADSFGISADTVEKIRVCATVDTEGRKLHRDYGVMTSGLTPSVSFIPTIVVDNSQDEQSQMLKDFKKYMCAKMQKDFDLFETPQFCQV